MDTNRTTFADFFDHCSSSARAALRELLRSLEYAAELDKCEWEFVVDLLSFHRLMLSDNDLRWLVHSGYLSHAIETTTSADDTRKFTRSNALALTRRSCFVLTQKGASVSRALLQDEIIGAGGDREVATAVGKLPQGINGVAMLPTWDRSRQELRFGSVVVKRFRVPASSQEAVLAAFEEERWPPRIDDPLPPLRDICQKRRLQETIRSLNRNQKRPLIQFLGDGSARGFFGSTVGLKLLPGPWLEIALR